MPGFLLPPNLFISWFDTVLQFDLSDGTIKIDLSPSVISDFSGITDVSVKITRPDMTVADLGPVFVPNHTAVPSTAGSMNQVYSWNLPRVQQVYMWGIYTVTCTLNLGGLFYPVSKKFNLCAPNPKDPYSTDIQGTINLSVDCQLGTLTARGFCGYAYKQIPPYLEEYNITRYYPPEAELLPQKNIAALPFVVDAYMGLNKVKGVNVSHYDFGDNVFAIVRIVAEAEKDIRCGLDMEAVYCGMKHLLETMRACNATQLEYNNAFGEINALIWTATAGLQENKDVDEEIARLEKLLGVECRCKACVGEKVGPGCVPVCPQVTGIQAIVDDTATPVTLKVSFNGDNVPAGSKLQVHYREFCNGVNNAYTQITDVPITGGQQTISIDLTNAATYQVLLTTIMPDGSYCDPVLVTAPGNCTSIVVLNPPKPPKEPNEFRIDWGWAPAIVDANPNPFALNRLTDPTDPHYWNAYQQNKLVEEGKPIAVEYDGAPDLVSYLVLRYPKTESKKTKWNSTQFNYGTIPDQVFEAVKEDSTYYYVYSRVKPVLDPDNNKLIIFS